MASASARKVLLLGSAIDVRRAPPACEEGLNYLRMHTRFHQTQCEAMEGACTAEERPCREIAKKKRKCRFGPPAPPSRCRTRPRPSAATQSHLHDACFRGHTLVLIGMGPYDWGVIYSYLFCVRRDKDVSRFRTFLAENSGFLSTFPGEGHQGFYFKVCLAHKIKVCKMKKPFTVPGSLSHLPALPKPHGFIYPPEPVLHRSQHALGQACSQLAHRTDPQSTHTIARTSRTQTHISPLARAAAALHRRSCPDTHTRQLC